MSTVVADGSADRLVEPPASRHVRLGNWLVLGPTIAVFAVLAWNRRWMSDDGLIVLRTVRQILAGNGPVFNAGERVESNTSTLWTYLLVAFGWIPGLRLEWLAVVLGLLCSTGGLLLAMDGTRRLIGSPLVAPAGVLVLIALPPFRDFATSGLETGLITLWLGTTWWLLVRHARRTPTGPVWVTALVIGLGVLVRPDLALFSAVAGAGLLVLEWRGWRRGLSWAAAAAAIPVAYQVFRMGYYGLLTPNTALVKEASDALWGRGWAYLTDFAGPYHLWIPLALCLLLAGLGLRRTRIERRVAVVVAVPLLGGLALALYVVRVGGDFMHARMLLPALVSLLLPVLVVRPGRATVVPLVALGIWTVVAAGWLRTSYTTLPAAEDETLGIADERAAYVAASRHEHPILAEDFEEFTALTDPINAMLATGQAPAVLVQNKQGEWHRYPTTNGRTVATFFNIGGPGMLLPLDMWVHDPIGLANPVAAHTTPYPGRRIGHNKYAGTPWEVAELTRETPAELTVNGDFTVPSIEAIRGIFACPANRDGLDSVRAPLTFDRFRQNLVHAAARTSLRYDYDPRHAQRCG
ncbi:arabinofuranosyltransferase [Amycolatopsis lexingtonensis]|uniref:Arabinofuranosyltransferase n=1 Tax=Amycolatopsis lexingtonensis TaxID=218822 RepID=A0ABR9I2J1_9PSEU|nr:arabinofuranosyltransferase [Amycolatopsis lexingtonensis]MBE1497364.1 arabinofuranosyltransferase [Amycolatopsis lexingtonensis]